jgi:hypothetical protein
MDLQAAADGQDIGDDDNATTVMRRDHQALRKAFAHYRALMNDAAAERLPLAQDIGMQLELHFSITRELFYPAMASRAGNLTGELLEAQEDIQECVDTLRGIQPADGAELDSTMVRLIELADIYVCKERKLIETPNAQPVDLADLGRRMVDRRKQIAGAVEDLESRS